MRLYLLSLAAGLAVGVFYALIQLRSPAPPVIALVGLLGILIGEQLPTTFRCLWRQYPVELQRACHAPPHSPATAPTAPRSGDL